MTAAAALRARLQPLLTSVKTQLSPNRSSRRGAPVRAVVIHTTEGGFEGSVAWLRNTGSSASSHYVIGDTKLRSGWAEVVRLVPESQKAWTALSANATTVNYELAGYASRTKADWLGRYRAQLETCAALVAEDTATYGIPVRRAYPGILGHVDLSKYGFPQTHHDPGAGFPWTEFLAMVRSYRNKPVKPFQTVQKIKGVGRPKGVPHRVPKWAWALHAYWLKPPKTRGPKPNTPHPVPDWFWQWRAWRMGVTEHRA